MGVHFTVTVDHEIHDPALQVVRDRFARLQPMFLEIAGYAQDDADTWQDVTRSGTSPPDHFYVPAGFSLQIGPAALKFHHRTRFSTFIGSTAETGLLRRFSRQLARLLGQQKVLYAPCSGIGDEIADWLSDGLSLAEIEAQLRLRSSPPTTIEELARRSLPELCYYIDDFGNDRVEATW